MTKRTSAAIIAILSLSIGHIAYADTLTLSVETPTIAGSVMAGVFADADAFARGDVVSGAIGTVTSGVTDLVVHDLAAGTYGIAIFQDLNGNGELDQNLLGIPTEPFGFSNNIEIAFTAPKFEDFSFEYSGAPIHLDILLNE